MNAYKSRYQLTGLIFCYSQLIRRLGNGDHNLSYLRVCFHVSVRLGNLAQRECLSDSRPESARRQAIHNKAFSVSQSLIIRGHFEQFIASDRQMPSEHIESGQGGRRAAQQAV